MTQNEIAQPRPIPNPGSDAALDRGCCCPVLDNAHGLGYLGIPGQWVFVVNCPLHCSDSEKKERSHMTNYQHTPSPWKIFEGNGDARGESWISVTTINQDCARRIATIENHENWSAEYQANVRLISLAPKLLEMLDRLALHLSDEWIDEHPELHEEAMQLIAEVKGIDSKEART